MDPDVYKVHMQNLEQYVLDENKIVTSKWLSNNLSLHINVAKTLMQEFLECQRLKHKEIELAVTYFVSGFLKDQKGQTCTIVNESDLLSLKESLESVLCEQIYSVQKKKDKTDFNALFLAGQCDDFCPGAIKNNSIYKRSREELSSLRLGAYPIAGAPVGKTIQKNTIPNKEIVTIKKEVVKEETTSNNTNGNESNNKSPLQKNVDTKKKDVLVSKGKSSITGFFSKQTSSPKIVKPVQKVEPDCNGKDESKNKKAESPNVISFPKVEKTISNGGSKNISPVKESQNKPVEVNAGNKSNSKNKKLSEKKKSSKNNKDANKKRKRIQCFDSDSENGSGSDDDIFKSSSPEPVNNIPLSDDEDVIPATPEVTKPVPSKLSLNSRKRKKLVDKMYMKDDGYILTVKEEVYESCSDEEVVEEPKNVIEPKISPMKNENNENKKPNNRVESKSKSKKKASPQGQSKQSSLMSFFSKK